MIQETKKFKLLKKYFEKEKSIILAFLFGSFAKGLEMKESDIDIAVYLEEKSQESKIKVKIRRILERDIDFILLNEKRLPASLVSNIFKTGIPLVIKNKKLYWHLYLKNSLETEDFLYFVRDYLKIKERAKSLTKEDEIELSKRFDFLKNRFLELEKFQKLKFKEYQENMDKRRIVERWTETTINALIDIAKITLASEKKEMPRSYGDALLYFGILIGLKEEDYDKFSEFADLRNILAHEYLEILYQKIRNFISDFPNFYPKISSFLEKYKGQRG